jgi:copper chaperone
MNQTPHTHTFAVQGMRCAHCDMAVTNAITEQDALAQVKVDRTQGALAKVVIVSHLDAPSLKGLIESEGYQVSP